MAYEYTTPELVASEVRATAPFDGSTIPTLDEVTNWIQEESDDINQIAGYVIGEETYSDVINYDGCEIITLKNSPVITVTQVLYSTSQLGKDDYSLTNVAVANTDYAVTEEKGLIHVLPYHTKFKEGLKMMQVDYTAGFADTPDYIQKLATKKVALRILDQLLAGDTTDGNVGGSVSVGSISIVEPEEFGTKRYSTLQNTVMKEEEKLGQGSGVYRYVNY